MTSAVWYRSARSTAGAFLLLAVLGGCASLVPQTMGLREAWPAGAPSRTEIAGVAFFPQVENQCGPAALATVLVKAGVAVTPEDLVKQVYLPARAGSLQVDMLAAPRRHSLVSFQLAPRFDDLLREVAAGNPVVILQDTGIGPVTNWHYAVVVGYDYAAGELYLRSGETRREVIPFTILEYTWKKSGYWAMVVMPPEHIAATATESVYLPAIAAMDRVGQARAALSAYVAFLARWPENLDASIGLANKYYALGELAKAEHVLRSTSDRYPESVVALNNLAQTLSDQGHNREALTLIERAMRHESKFDTELRETRDLIRRRLAQSS